MEGRGKIIISGSQSSSWVEVVVRDFGPGIPPEMHQRIFELNFSSGSPSHAGKLGFGLYWVKALMIRLGGSVDVESDGMSGTAFRLRFPLRRKPL
jgi:signal transduction histidine kinase